MVPRGMSSTNSATPRHAVQDQGRELLDHLGLLDLRALHRQRRREQIQWGKQDIVFAGGGEELDWTLSLLFDAMGAMSSQFNDTPAARQPRLRRQPRRLRHRRRRRRRRAGGARARQGARRQDLRRAHRLWRHLRRLRHGRALGRGRRALHAPGARDAAASAASTTSTRTAPRRRSATSRRSRRAARSSATDDAADQLDQVADRPLARRRRRAGGDLLPPDAGATTSSPPRPISRPRSRAERHADRARARSTTPSSTRSCRTASASAARTPRSRSAVSTDEPRVDEHGDQGRHRRAGTLMEGKRGLVMGVANDHSIAWGIARALRAQGAELAFTYQGEAFGRRVVPLADRSAPSIVAAAATSTTRPSLDAAFAALGDDWGSARLRRPRHRLFRQERADRALCRHQPRELPAHDAHLVLLLHRRGAAGGRADAGRRLAAHHDLSAAEARHAELQRHGRGQGGAGGVACAISPPISARRASASTRSRAGPMRTLAGSAIGGARRVYKTTEANAPLRRNAALEHVGGAAVYLLSDLGASTTGEILFVDSGYHALGMAQFENLPKAPPAVAAGGRPPTRPWYPDGGRRVPTLTALIGGCHRTLYAQVGAGLRHPPAVRRRLAGSPPPAPRRSGLASGPYAGRTGGRGRVAALAGREAREPPLPHEHRQRVGHSGASGRRRRTCRRAGRARRGLEPDLHGAVRVTRWRCRCRSTRRGPPAAEPPKSGPPGSPAAAQAAMNRR